MTAPTTSQLTLYNGALLVLKARRLTALTDARTERRVLDDVYDKCVQAMLEAGDWNFANRTTMLEASVDVEPGFGYNYAFERPTDFVRITSVSANELMWPQISDFREESAGDDGIVWLANCDPLYVSYVSNDDLYGLNLARWPQSFVRAVEHDLALQIAPHVTQMSEKELIALEQKCGRRLAAAKAKDARAQSPQWPPPGRLVQARQGGRSGGWKPWERGY